MQPVIDNGHLYLAKPPLFELIKPGRKTSTFVYDENDLEVINDKAIADRKAKGVEINNEEARFKQAGFVEQKRYKGLGEMNADQLFDTTMDPQKRILVQVRVADAEKADAIFNKLMGSEVEPRKNFIQTHAKFVKDLDI